MRNGRARGPNPFVQGARFGAGFDAQLRLQQTLADPVLGQRRRALTAAHEGGHQLPVRLFAPRVDRQHTTDAVDHLAILSAHQLQLRLRVEGVQCQVTQARFLGQHPLFKLRRVAHKKTGQKLTRIQGGCRLQGERLLRGRQGLGALQMVLKSFHIQKIRRVCVKTNRVPTHKQMGIDQFAQIGQHLA